MDERLCHFLKAGSKRLVGGGSHMCVWSVTGRRETKVGHWSLDYQGGHM